MKRKMMENDKLQEISKKKNLKLAPETMRIRDAIIEKYSDTPLDALSTKLQALICLLYTSPSPRDVEESRMPSSA